MLLVIPQTMQLPSMIKLREMHISAFETPRIANLAEPSSMRCLIPL